MEIIKIIIIFYLIGFILSLMLASLFSHEDDYIEYILYTEKNLYKEITGENNDKPDEEIIRNFHMTCAFLSWFGLFCLVTTYIGYKHDIH